MATLEETPKNATHWSRDVDGRAQRAVEVDDRADLAQVRPQAAPEPTGSSCPPTRCSWRRSSMSSACTTTRPSGRWCCALTRRRQIQALDRSQPVLPMMPGMPERRTHDYVRHGITSLFAAFNIADGTVIAELHRKHRAVEFKKFLRHHRQEPSPPSWTCTCLRQPRHPQDPGDQRVAGPPPPLPHALHPDRLLLDQPGRTLVRLPHRPDAPARCPQERASAGDRRPRLDHSTGTTTPNRSCGRRPPKRSSTPSPDIQTNFRRGTLPRAGKVRREAVWVGAPAAPIAGGTPSAGTVGRPAGWRILLNAAEDRARSLTFFAAASHEGTEVNGLHAP